jgi:hypothetical protein
MSGVEVELHTFLNSTEKLTVIFGFTGGRKAHGTHRMKAGLDAAEKIISSPRRE